MDYKVISAKRLITREQADELVGTEVPNRVANITEASVFFDEETNEPIVAYLPMDREVVKAIRNSLLNIKMSSTKRMATGLMNLSRTFGMAPRNTILRRESCRPTGLANESPKEHATIVNACYYLEDQLKELFPEVWEHDKVETKNIGEDWLMGEDALWTSGVINKSATLPYHRDGFNFDTWSAMPVIRRGVEGGMLHFPEWDITIECKDGWAVYFCGYRWLHGVTPMKKLVEDGYRFSIVYYALRGMKDCFTYAVETARGKTKRTEREDGIADAISGKAEFKIKS
jgi:hypothetical protein